MNAATKKPLTIAKKVPAKVLQKKVIASNVTSSTNTLATPNNVKADSKVDVQWVDIDSVKQWKDNPMGHGNKDIEMLSKILQAHGQRSPIIVWRKNMTIYKGNGTHQAMKKLGMKKIKVQFEDFPSEAAAKAYGIADNKASELSDWDADTLVSILSSEEMKAIDNPVFGFTESELRGLNFQADEEKIDSLEKTDTGIKATIKITCKPEDRDEIREILKAWGADCGFEEVVVK
jgi:hypothetical protein